MTDETLDGRTPDQAAISNITSILTVVEARLRGTIQDADDWILVRQQLRQAARIAESMANHHLNK